MDKEDRLRAPMPEQHEVAFRLAAMFKALGIKPQEAANTAGCGKSTVSQWLGKGQPRTITLLAAIRLCAEYGVTLDYIYRARFDGMPYDLVQKLRNAEGTVPKLAATKSNMTKNNPAKSAA